MAKFKAFTWGSYFTLAVCVAFILAAVIGVAVHATLQTIVVGMAAAGSGGYIAYRYYEAKKHMAREFTVYHSMWDYNVFCCDELARVRWNFGVAAEISKAFAVVAEKMDAAHYLGGLDIRIVSEPFVYGGLPGLNRGVTHNGTIIIAWLPGELAPTAVLCHELAHVVLENRDGIWGQEMAHAKMQELKLPW